MSVCVHKMLIHGSENISTTILPTGHLSEEAQESRNKDVKPHEGDLRENSVELLHLLLVS